MPDHRYRARREEILERLAAGIRAGRSLRSLCADPAMPPQETVNRWMREDPALNAGIAAARAWTWQRSPAGRAKEVDRLERRLLNGLSLFRACREPGAPNYYTVMLWCRADPQLRVRLRRAVADGMGQRPHHSHQRFFYDYDKVDRFRARVAAGEPISEMQAARTGPDQATVRAWRAMRPEFVERFEAAKRQGAAARRLRPRRPFDRVTADAIVLAVVKGAMLPALMRRPGMPGLTALGRWRRARPDFDRVLKIAILAGRRARAAAGPTPELARRIARTLAMGATTRAMLARPWAPDEGTYYKWRRRYPEFDQKIRDAIDFREWMAADRAQAAAEDADPQAAEEERARVRRAWG